MSGKFKLPKLIGKVPEFDDLIARAKSDPITLVEHCRRRSVEYYENVQWMHWCVLVFLYAAALNIAEDVTLIAKLLQLPCFAEQPYQRNIKDVLRLVMLAGLDAPPRGSAYKKVCHEASLLKPFFKDAIDPETLLGRIKASDGMKSLKKNYLGSGDSKKPKVGDDKDVKALKIDGKDCQEAKVSHEGQTKTTKASNDRPTPAEVDDPEEIVILEIEVTRKRLNRLTRSPDRITGTISFETAPGGPDSKRVIATGVVVDR